MDKAIGYVALVFRLAFLPMKKHLISKKWRIVILLTANIVMLYAVFVISIQPYKSTFMQVSEAYGVDESILQAQLSRLNSIIFKRARKASSISIVPTAELEAQCKQDSIYSADALSLEDAEFLLDLASRKK